MRESKSLVRTRIEFGRTSEVHRLSGPHVDDRAVLLGLRGEARADPAVISPGQNFAVVRWIDAKSSAPRMGLVLWAAVIKYCDVYTGEVVRSRQQLADDTDMDPGQVGRLLRELASLGIIEKRRIPVEGISGPGAVRYWLRLDMKPREIFEHAGLPSAPGEAPARWRRRPRRSEKEDSGAGAPDLR